MNVSQASQTLMRAFGSATRASFPVSRAQHVIQSAATIGQNAPKAAVNARFDMQAQRQAQQYWVDMAKNQKLTSNARVYADVPAKP
ncbi:hypothetical protein CAOG_03493 [Capsaspora owczarzaki ATCC 30864]|uniref:Uncharacterized protein n=1 Tax=Capsaspora owczarzaki (strain ATCC 30864) TaxID=595528 RepID=A0A0D2VPU8_CAPO3|nr:hypothetical protein CAOG_03493 [Capsaspora owczarzaki ATCC 30864]KJE92547.1 hypothetical protein CAOG_003493 [Capsaspora owczarzaki ATCC 30864]|eukprot:XP_004348398.1 hypothetical protein CAOG_03493 [Capsaspora owczarzaki ATCC 30864]